jgi:hypothetical protein
MQNVNEIQRLKLGPGWFFWLLELGSWFLILVFLVPWILELGS